MSLVDWDLAASVASTAAGGSPPAPDAETLDRAVAEASEAVQSYTGLHPDERVPAPEWVSRREWASVNVASLHESLTVLEQRIPGGAEGDAGLPGPLGGIIGGAFAKLAAVQLGALVGYSSRRVLGQYEFSLLGPEREPRLLFVAPNIAEAQRSLDGEPRTILGWIALHEVTHAVHFGSASWLRGHLRGLARSLIEESRLGLDLGQLAGSLAKLATSSPREILEGIRGSDPLTLLAAPEDRELIASTQATMAAIEGYAEHVMDAAAPALGEDVGALRSSMERRRDRRPAPARLLSWLFGMDLKLRQYREGKRFADAVVEAEGITALNRAWRGAESLPKLEEIGDSDAWLRRTGG